MLRSFEVAHQFLPKPFDLDVLQSAVDRACTLRDRLDGDSLQKIVSTIRTLPSLPDLYQELVAVMQSPAASTETIVPIVSKDMAMVSKMLQVVNSAFFGLRRMISRPAHAVALLGLDTVKSLVLTLQVFRQFEQDPSMPVSIDSLWRHGLATASLARRIAELDGVGSLGIQRAFMAGLLRDIGVLVLATNFPDRFAEVIERAKIGGRPMAEVERELLGTTEAEAGAYLLGIWSLDNAIVEAVAFHHAPASMRQSGFSLLSVVHATNALEEVQDTTLSARARTVIDQEYLGYYGLSSRLPIWREQCRLPTASAPVGSTSPG